jgi:hypothetical protein
LNKKIALRKALCTTQTHYSIIPLFQSILPSL